MSIAKLCFLAIIVTPKNPETGCGCKNCDVKIGLSAQGFYANSTICINANKTEVIKCLEEEVYTKKDVIINYTHHTTESLKPITTTSFYTSAFIGYILHSIHISNGAMTRNLVTTCSIELNHNLTYQILFMDPKLQLTTASPTVFPRSVLNIKETVAGNYLIYFEVLLWINAHSIKDIQI